LVDGAVTSQGLDQDGYSSSLLKRCDQRRRECGVLSPLLQTSTSNACIFAGTVISFPHIEFRRHEPKYRSERRRSASLALNPQLEKCKGETMGAILELTTYAATPVGMVAIVAIGAAAYFAARWVLVD
jgi:hypothetical protein